MSEEHDDDMTGSPKPPVSGEIVHFNPWRDFNDAPCQIDVFGDEPDPEQIAQFIPGVPLAHPVPTLAFDPRVTSYPASPVQDEVYNMVELSE